MNNFKNINSINYFEKSEMNKKYFFKIYKELYKENEEVEEWKIDFNSTFDFVVDKDYYDRSLFKLMFGHKGEWEDFDYVLLYKKEPIVKGYCKYIKCDCKQQKLRPINADSRYAKPWERDYHKCCWEEVRFDPTPNNDLLKLKYKDLNKH